MVDVYGALASVLRVRQERIDAKQLAYRVQWIDGTSSRTISRVNADLLLKRLWIGESDEVSVDHLRHVAAACHDVPAGLLDKLHTRRRAAAERLAARAGVTARSVRITPRWRLVIGHGEDSANETSLTMSPTYGFPIIPGSAVKGLAASQARAEHGDGPLPTGVVRLFGTPRPGIDAPAAQGTVVVLDALPVEPPRVVVDVLTPHVKPYYDKDPDGQPKEPPAEYHNPVPVRFLAVAGNAFRAWLIGPPGDLERFTELLESGADDLGLGAKTAAGYGYCKVEVEP